MSCSHHKAPPALRAASVEQSRGLLGWNSGWLGSPRVGCPRSSRASLSRQAPGGGGTRGRLHGADLRLELPGELLSVCLVLVVVELPTLTLHSVNHRLLLPSLLLTPHMQ